jgi:hypothetical protein
VWHYSSRVVHNVDLVDGPWQRELFSELAGRLGLGHAGIIIPYGRMAEVATYNDIFRVINDGRSIPPAVLVIDIPQRMAANSTMSFDNLK